MTIVNPDEAAAAKGLPLGLTFLAANLGEIADHFESRAADLLKCDALSVRDGLMNQREATTWNAAAEILRNTRLDPP